MHIDFFLKTALQENSHSSLDPEEHIAACVT